MKMTNKYFTEEEILGFEEDEIVGYDNGNDHMHPVRVAIYSGSGHFDVNQPEHDYFYCEEYDCTYDLDDLDDDWFVKA